MQTRVLTAHVPIDLAKQLDKVAVRLERSRGWIVQKALADWIEREDAHRRMTLEALADVEAGRVVDNEVVRAWAAGLGKEKAKKR